MVSRNYFRRVHLPYIVELAAAMVAYGAVLLISLLALNAMPHNSAWRPVVALLPMLPALGVVVAVVRVYRRIDELERRQLLESIGIAFAGTAVVTFAYGFLELVGFPRLSWFFVWVIMGGFWLGARLVNRLRYR
jgi:multisubunit Na+/H+ antiporter MnhB subunit